MIKLPKVGGASDSTHLGPSTLNRETEWLPESRWNNLLPLKRHTTTQTTMKNNHETIKRLKTLWESVMSDHHSWNSSTNTSITTTIQELSCELNSTYGPLYPKILLPNVRKFQVKVLSNYHPIFEEEGILKRQYSPIFESTPYRNQRMNRWLQYQFLRLNKSTHRPGYFWRIAETLTNRSSSYLTLCLYNIDRVWHRKRDYIKVWESIKSCRNLNLTLYEYHKLPIPKDPRDPSKGERYLGIPTLPWRIYLHGLQSIMQVWLVLTAILINMPSKLAKEQIAHGNRYTMKSWEAATSLNLIYTSTSTA